jgi:hypothetical protein
MKKNVGGIDRIMRILLGLLLLFVGYFYQSWWGLIGLVPLGTAALGWCPAYLPFGWSSCKNKG